MKYNFKKDQTVYYLDWQDFDMKIPAVIVNVRRTWATVLLYSGIFKWELTDVPMEDLEPTDDFTSTKGEVLGSVRSLVWKDDRLNREYFREK